jgi:hypothetical protein
MVVRNQPRPKKTAEDIARHAAKAIIEKDPSWRFPNGSRYYNHGIPIHPTSDAGKIITKIILRQLNEEN